MQAHTYRSMESFSSQRLLHLSFILLEWSTQAEVHLVLSVAQRRGRTEQKRDKVLKWVQFCVGNIMTAYLSKQQSCFGDLDGRRDTREPPCSFSWQHQHHCHQHYHPCLCCHYGFIPGGGTLPRRGGQRTAWHLYQTFRSPSRLAVLRAKWGSCDLWPSECGCIQSWQEPFQVKHQRTGCHYVNLDTDKQIIINIRRILLHYLVLLLLPLF